MEDVNEDRKKEREMVTMVVADDDSLSPLFRPRAPPLSLSLSLPPAAAGLRSNAFSKCERRREREEKARGQQERRKGADAGENRSAMSNPSLFFLSFLRSPPPSPFTSLPSCNCGVALRLASAVHASDERLRLMTRRPTAC